MNALRSVSLVDDAARLIFIAALVLAALYALYGIRGRRTAGNGPRARGRRTARIRTAIALAAGVIAPVAAWLVLEVIWKPFPDHVPAAIYAAGGVVVFVALALLLQPAGWVRRIGLAVATAVAVASASGIANLTYQQYPTLGSLDPEPLAVNMTWDQFQTARRVPVIDGVESGALVTVPMDGTDSGFDARDAVAWVPPAYWTRPDVKLPVLVLLVGSPGDPGDWFSSGQATLTADEFQVDHGGVAPIIISVDPTGSYTGNPGCVDGPDVKMDTYLGSDVPELIRDRFRVNPDQRTWTIGGLSYGGTCALQIVTNHPDAYGSFLDFSGEAEPTLGSHDKTVQVLFGGDEDAFERVNAANLLEGAANGTNPADYSHIEGRFIAGEKDVASVDALRHLDELARGAHMSTTFEVLPGGHSYQVWRAALQRTLPWVAERGGIR